MIPLLAQAKLVTTACSALCYSCNQETCPNIATIAPLLPGSSLGALLRWSFFFRGSPKTPLPRPWTATESIRSILTSSPTRLIGATR
ncbi:hypothetical protein LZ30DRAFT_721780 [Colletotrichum cereale]|nr:hypothetical protein LZ30DRAFT_721780 [Colletotrichum cereale]